jgi:uncharacterized protein YciI
VPEFIYQFLAGDRPELLTDPDAWSEEDERASAEHYERLRQATEDGVVILAGRSLDGVGPSVVVFEAESEEDARRFMEEDPFLTKGLFVASLHPFRAALVRDPQRPTP